MTEERFQELTPSQLEAITGIHKANWSRYLNGTLLSEATLNRAAAALEMPPESLLKAINQKRIVCRNRQGVLI